MLYLQQAVLPHSAAQALACFPEAASPERLPGFHKNTGKATCSKWL
jgi:hypothetical protein